MCGAAIPSFPIQQAIHGFPTVHKLQKLQVSSFGPSSHLFFSAFLIATLFFFQGQKVEDANKKKSLFAQQFESSGLERFGLVARTPKLPSIATSQVERDRVDPPVSLSVRERKEEERVADMESSPVDQSVDMADLETTGEGSTIHTLLTEIQKLDNCHIHSLTHSLRTPWFGLCCHLGPVPVSPHIGLRPGFGNRWYHQGDSSSRGGAYP